MLLRRLHLAAAAALVLALAACADEPTAPSAPAAPAEPAAAASARAGRVIPNRWIVVFHDRVSDAPGLARQLAAAHGGTLHHTYRHAIKGFAATLPAGAAEALRRNPNVAFVEADQVVVPAQTTQPGATWGLARIDQRDPPPGTDYTYVHAGQGVTVYVIDSGIQTSHPEFGGRAWVGYDALGGNGQDCLGHGTHVAGTIGSATYGVAKQAGLVSVRVFDCFGNSSTSAVIAGIDWVRYYNQKPAVANLSLTSWGSTAMDNAVRNMISPGGVTTVVGAGNEGRDACLNSPARVAEAITVGASTMADQPWASSNYGSCLDLYAPGEFITSTWLNGGTETISGTSMATPHVAGVAALYLSGTPPAGPITVAKQILLYATTGRLTNLPYGSPDRLVYSLFQGASGRVPIHRRYNPNWGDHMYTLDIEEGWEIGYFPEFPNYFYVQAAPTAGHVPLYHCHIWWTRDHSLSDNMSCGGSANLGLVGYMALTQLPGTVPLYTLEKPSVDWFFTVDPAERQNAMLYGWRDRGIAGYVYLQP